MTPLAQHQLEIESNLQAWNRKPLLQQIYGGFYERIVHLLDDTGSGLTVEIGSGIGNLKKYFPGAIATDLFPNPWLDLVCDGYELPFKNRSILNLVLFDVFHHLEAPVAWLREAKRVLAVSGRVILFEPFMSLTSFPVYSLFHHEPVAWKKEISKSDELARPRRYYAAQGNATRLFFGKALNELWSRDWRIFHQEAFSAWSYLLCGGYSKPAFYPSGMLPRLRRMDSWLSRHPGLFGGRCLVGLRPRD